MTKLRFVVVAAFVTIPFIGRAVASPPAQDELAGVPRISQTEFKKVLAAGNVLVIDVRDAASYANGHIPGAVSIPLDEVTKHVRDLKAERRPIVTYCA